LIETSLLSLSQQWTFNDVVLDQMISENKEVSIKRNELKERKNMILKAIERINQQGR
jgi:hypothetical protein